jgi:hypothetical protein
MSTARYWPDGIMLAVDATDDVVDHLLHLGAGQAILRRQFLAEGHQLLSAPLVEVAHMHAVAQALGFDIEACSFTASGSL